MLQTRANTQPCQTAANTISSSPHSKRRMAENELHVWIVSAKNIFPDLLPLPQKHWAPECVEKHVLYSGLIDILSKEERQQFYKFKVAEAALVYLAAHVMCRVTLSNYAFGLSTCKEEFGKHPYGKPYIEKTHAGLPRYFNLSHSWPLAALTVTNVAECGVDIEMFNPKLPWRELSNEVLHPAEQERVLSSRDPAHAFFRFWTLKEAAAKTVGRGLQWDFRSFSIQEHRKTVLDQEGAEMDLGVQSLPYSYSEDSTACFLSVGCMVPPDSMPDIKIHQFKWPFAPFKGKTGNI